MHTRIQHDAGAELVLVSGEIDLATSDAFLKAMHDALLPLTPLCVDLGDVEFMDSTGLHALVTIKQSAAAAGSDLVLVRLSSQVERLLELTGMRDYFLADRPT